MDIDDKDSSPSTHSLLDKLKLEVCADSNDDNQRKLTINSPMIRNNDSRNIPSDIDKEITDLENLIKRLQVEINQMSVNASKPLKDYVLSNDCNDSELKKEIMTYPIHNDMSNNSGQELDDVRRTFKLLWNDNTAANTSDVPELNLINELDEDIDDDTLDKLDAETEDASKSLNIHILRDYIAAKKKEMFESSTFPAVENISNEFNETKPAMEVIPKLPVLDEIKPIDDNKAQTSSDNKPDSTIRLGILMHIFGDKKSDDKKCDIGKALDTNTTNQNYQNSPTEFSHPTTTTVNIVQTKTLKPEKILSDNTATEKVKPKTNDLTNSYPETINKDHSGTIVNNMQTLDDSHKTGKHKKENAHHHDTSSETDIKAKIPAAQAESTTSNSVKISNISNNDLKKPNPRHTSHVKYPSTRTSKTKNVSINQSREGLTKQDLKNIHEVHRKYDSKTDVPRRLSIINIYLDSQKPVSNVIIHKKPKSNVNIHKSGHRSRTPSPSHLLQNVSIKPKSDADINKLTKPSKDENQCDEVVKTSKGIYSQDIKTPSNDTTINSEKIEISEAMKKANQNKGFVNPSLRTPNPNPHMNQKHMNSNPKLLENDLSKSLMTSTPQSNKVIDLNEMNIPKETKYENMNSSNKNPSLTFNNATNNIAEVLLTVTGTVKDLQNLVSISDKIASATKEKSQNVIDKTTDSLKRIENDISSSQITSTNDEPSQQTIKTIVKDSSKLSHNTPPTPIENIVNIRPIKTVEIDDIDKDKCASINTPPTPTVNVITKPTTLDTTMNLSEDYHSEASVISPLILDSQMKQSADFSKEMSKQTSTNTYIDTYSTDLTSEASKQTETDISYKAIEDVKNEITSTADVTSASENMSQLTSNKSAENVSFETEDLTDEYESVADDNESCTDDSVSNEPQIVIQKTEITINNGDNFSDVFEDSQDISREASQEHQPRPKRKK